MAEFIYILYYSIAHDIGNTNIVFLYSLLHVFDIKIKYKIRIIMQSFTLQQCSRQFTAMEEAFNRQHLPIFSWLSVALAYDKAYKKHGLGADKRVLGLKANIDCSKSKFFYVGDFCWIDKK